MIERAGFEAVERDTVYNSVEKFVANSHHEKTGRWNSGCRYVSSFFM